MRASLQTQASLRMRTSSLDLELYVNENRLYFTHKSLEGQLKHCKSLIYYIYFM